MPAIEQAPVITTGTSETAGRTTRGGLQNSIGAFIVSGIMLFGLAKLTPDQAVWLGMAISTTVAFVQNTIEVWAKRKLIGNAPSPATAPPAP